MLKKKESRKETLSLSYCATPFVLHALLISQRSKNNTFDVMYYLFMVYKEHTMLHTEVIIQKSYYVAINLPELSIPVYDYMS